MPLPRVSVVQYLNTAPLVWGMLKGEQTGKYNLSFTTPAQCAEAVRKNDAEIGIIPSIEYQKMDHVQVLGGLSISSRGEARSVLLLSKMPIENVETIALDNSSRTSAALVRILMRRFYSRFVTVTPAAPKPEEMLKRADAALVIGDPALAYEGPVAEVYDLAAEWKKFTGLPFVFALWVGHERARIGNYQEDFKASRDFGLAHLSDIGQEYGPKLNMSPEAVQAYLTENIHYSLDEEEKKGLKLFYKLAREVGVVPAEKELVFA
jgi:chorismate dehydratase